MTKNKVLFFHNTLAWYRLELFKELQKDEDISIEYIFTRDSIKQKVYDINNDEYINYTLNKTYIEDKNRIKQIIHLLNDRTYDTVVLPPMDSIGELFDALIILSISRLKKKHICYFWEKWEFDKCVLSRTKKFKKNIMRKVFKMIFKKIDTFIAPGTNSSEYFESLGVERDRIFVAPDTSIVDDNNKYFDLRDKYKIDKKDKIILFYGRIIELKGLQYLIEAFKLLDNENFNVKLIICGDGEYKNVCEKMVSDKYKTKILFLGKIATKFRATIFSQIDIFVLPSIEVNGQVEAWGLTVNEVMYFGKPIIVSNAVGCYKDLVINNKNGYIVNQRSSNELYKAIKKICLNKDMEISMGQESKKIIKKYTYRNMANGFKKSFISS